MINRYMYGYIDQNEYMYLGVDKIARRTISQAYQLIS